MNNNRPWLQTRSGLAWYADDPGGYTYDVEEIAHALSCMPRFAGHTTEFYSVAQHSVIVCRAARLSHSERPRGFYQAALLHDAAEAFCLDVPAPIKRMPMMREYRMWEKEVERAIHNYFVLGVWRGHPAIKTADLRALSTERRDVLGPSPKEAMWLETELGSLPLPMKSVIKPLPPKQAKALFLRVWESL